MKQSLFIIRENTPIAPGVFLLRLDGDTSAFTAPGQFLSIRLDSFFLRRPFSVCDWDDTGVTVIYKILGSGTDALSRYPSGRSLDVLTGLGNGFDLSRAGAAPLLAGGGVGIPPLVRLAKELVGAGTSPAVVLGFGSRADIILAERFEALGIRPRIATADGSAGTHGFVTDAMPAAGTYTHVFACGPTAMLRALDRVTASGAQYSLEERMGCCFGACMGCTIETTGGPKRICREGPVFSREELLW